MATERRVLVAGWDDVGSAPTGLAALTAWLDVVPWDHSVGDRLRTVCHDLVVVRFPVPGPPTLTHLLKVIRHRDSASLRSGLILIADAASLADALAYVGRGANRVVATESGDEALVDAARSLLSVAPRLPVRAPTRIVVHAEPAARTAFCQTENLSRTGMLIRGFGHYPPGTPLDFELSLPGLEGAIRGSAEIRRRTNAPVEQLEGFGARFTSFAGGDDRRLDDFLGRVAS